MRSRSVRDSVRIAGMTEVTARTGLERLLRPRSVAIVGISKEPGSLGETQVGNFDRFGFTGELHLVSRNREAVGDRRCVRTVEELPHGIDAAVLCVPRSGVVETLEALAALGVGGAMVFASGFAEQDEAGRHDQERIVEIAARSGMAVNGPNCLGLTNFVDGIPYAFGPTLPPIVHDGIAAAVVSQSGATMVNIARGLATRGVSVTYQMSTGNEAVLGIEDHLAFVLDDDRPGPIALFAEQIRRPQMFLALAERARKSGRHLVLLHPGRSEGARAAAQSHTGALAGDYDVMRTVVEHAGVMLVDDLDMLVDAITVLARYPEPPVRGVAVTSDSGAVKSLALDECAALGLDLPGFTPPTIDAIHEALPSFAVASNPLDLTAQCIYDRFLYERTAHAMLGDPNVGSFVAIVQPGPNLRWLQENALFDELRATSKPALLALPLGTSRWPDELVAQMIERKIPFTGTGSQALRAIAALTKYGRRRASLNAETAPPAMSSATKATIAAILALAKPGPLAEHHGKAVLAALGIPVPAGGLARDISEARAIAERIGYPVVLKVQAPTLLHKTDAGGVAVGIAGTAALEAAWTRVTASVARARPDLVLDGMLIEAMGAPGLELVAGAKRDPGWGTVLLAGLGGIWIETLGDAALFAAGSPATAVVAGLEGLKGAALLAGVRGGPAVDVAAVADAVVRIGSLMEAFPEIREVDVNPLVATPHGVLALDALVVRGE
jgi:acetate---CoA ligase (ADP-forming)